MKLLIQKKINFVFKIAKNKKVTTEDGISKQIQHHPNFKMQRNQRSKVVPIKYYGMTLYVSVHKFKNERTCSWRYLYIVSNIHMHAKYYLEFYQKRWKIEVFFRSVKQNLGLGHCQSRSFEIQRNHTRSVFTAYIFLQYQKFFNTKNNLYDVKTSSNATSINPFARNFGYYA